MIHRGSFNSYQSHIGIFGDEMKVTGEICNSNGLTLIYAASLILFTFSVVLFQNGLKTVMIYLDGFYGLLLIIGALILQTNIHIKEKGNLRSSYTFIVGLFLIIIGYATCFIPGIFEPYPQIILIGFICFIAIIFIRHILIHKREEKNQFGYVQQISDSGLSLDTIMEMQYGLYMLALGFFLIPVNLGFLPYSMHAILGVLVVLFGIQLLVSGRIMTYTFKRSIISFFSATVLIMAGSYSVAVQNMNISFLGLFIGIFIISGGLYLFYYLFRTLITTKQPTTKPKGKHLQIVIILLILAFLTAFLMIIFGLSLLIVNLLPGFYTVILLISFGFSQFALIYAQSLEKMYYER
mgnify:CR=1 FL=1